MGITLKPGDPEWKAYQRVQQAKLERIAKATDKATEAQWQMVEFAIQAWIQAYPRHWMIFQEDLARGRSEYNEALPEHKGLKKAQWRNTASFPIAYVYNPETGMTESKDLLSILKKIIPHLTDKHSVNYREFLKRFPAFKPSDKSNTSDFKAVTPYVPTAPTYPKKEDPTPVKRKRKRA